MAEKQIEDDERRHLEVAATEPTFWIFDQWYLGPRLHSRGQYASADEIWYKPSRSGRDSCFSISNMAAVAIFEFYQNKDIVKILTDNVYLRPNDFIIMSHAML